GGRRDVERSRPSICSESLGLQINGNEVLRGRCDETVETWFRKFDEQQPVVGGVHTKDVAESCSRFGCSCNNGFEVCLLDGPYGVFAAASTSEVFEDGEDGCALVLGIIQREAAAAQIFEQKFAIAGAGYHAQEPCGNDLIGINVRLRQKREFASVLNERFHVRRCYSVMKGRGMLAAACRSGFIQPLQFIM